jgi:hypothetical protein
MEIRTLKCKRKWAKMVRRHVSEVRINLGDQ